MVKKLLIVKVESVTVPFTGLLPGEHPAGFLRFRIV